ncbi:MAG: hypothetical protein ABEJ98_03045 [Candidatus Nanohaloarchaea archaeon]
MGEKNGSGRPDVEEDVEVENYADSVSRKRPLTVRFSPRTLEKIERMADSGLSQAEVVRRLTKEGMKMIGFTSSASCSG